jgi:hypothetical protein
MIWWAESYIVQHNFSKSIRLCRARKLIWTGRWKSHLSNRRMPSFSREDQTDQRPEALAQPRRRHYASRATCWASLGYVSGAFLWEHSELGDGATPLRGPAWLCNRLTVGQLCAAAVVKPSSVGLCRSEPRLCSFWNPTVSAAVSTNRDLGHFDIWSSSNLTG